MRDLTAIDCLGVISVATRGPDGVGEVVISVRGGTESYLAWSDDALPKGSQVVVVDVRGPRTVQVVSTQAVGLSTGIPPS